jgi:hypothetical protein
MLLKLITQIGFFFFLKNTSRQKHYTGGSQPIFTGGLENRLRWVPVEIKSFHRRVT